MSRKTKNHDFLMGYMEASDAMAEDMPDGAWFAFMEESGEEYIKYCNDRNFKDGNDVAHYYIEHHDEQDNNHE